MASYPTGVFSPAAKNTGNTIQAAHVNDLDTEVAAVENGLLNGLAHALVISTGGLTVSTGGARINGPSSIAGTVQVTGNSTITGSLSVSGNSTFDGNLTVAGTLSLAGGTVVGGRIPSARVSLASVLQINTGLTFAGINWTTNDYDSTGLHSTSANSSRILLTSSGLWAFGGQVVHESQISTVRLSVRVLANDNQALTSYERNGQVENSSGTLALPVNGVFLATDTTAYLTVQTRFTGGSATSTVYGSTGTGMGPTHFWVQKVSG
jgi:hypothetical protein